MSDYSCGAIKMNDNNNTFIYFETDLWSISQNNSPNWRMKTTGLSWLNFGLWTHSWTLKGFRVPRVDFLALCYLSGTYWWILVNIIKVFTSTLHKKVSHSESETEAVTSLLGWMVSVPLMEKAFPYVHDWKLWARWQNLCGGTMERISSQNFSV